MAHQHVLFVVGAAGYVGAMLCDQFSKRDDVKTIIGLDTEPLPELLKENGKILWIQENMAERSWQEKVAEERPDIVIHTAWRIRSLYGNEDLQWKWNVEGSDNVFDFAFGTPSVRKLIHFSTAAVYGARKDNRLDHFFTENEAMRDDEYLYAKEKKATEERLGARHRDAASVGRVPQVFVVRPAAITGPRGRHMRTRFGLQSALSGQLKGNVVYRVVSLMTSFVPATRTWVRQFVHEDDITDIVDLLAFGGYEGEYEVFNAAPPGAPVFAKDMADAVGKKVLPVSPFVVRIVFWFFWHATRGKIPTSPGSWRFYSYPVLMSGATLTRRYGFRYRYPSREAFRFTDGRYEAYVPKDLQRPSSPVA